MISLSGMSKLKILSLGRNLIKKVKVCHRDYFVIIKCCQKRSKSLRMCRVLLKSYGCHIIRSTRWMELHAVRDWQLCTSQTILSRHGLNWTSWFVELFHFLFSPSHSMYRLVWSIYEMCYLLATQSMMKCPIKKRLVLRFWNASLKLLRLMEIWWSPLNESWQQASLLHNSRFWIIKCFYRCSMK